MPQYVTNVGACACCGTPCTVDNPNYPCCCATDCMMVTFAGLTIAGGDPDDVDIINSVEGGISLPKVSPGVWESTFTITSGLVVTVRVTCTPESGFNLFVGQDPGGEQAGGVNNALTLTSCSPLTFGVAAGGIGGGFNGEYYQFVDAVVGPCCPCPSPSDCVVVCITNLSAPGPPGGGPYDYGDVCFEADAASVGPLGQEWTPTGSIVAEAFPHQVTGSVYCKDGKWTLGLGVELCGPKYGYGVDRACPTTSTVTIGGIPDTCDAGNLSADGATVVPCGTCCPLTGVCTSITVFGVQVGATVVGDVTTDMTLTPDGASATVEVGETHLTITASCANHIWTLSVLSAGCTAAISTLDTLPCPSPFSLTFPAGASSGCVDEVTFTGATFTDCAAPLTLRPPAARVKTVRPKLAGTPLPVGPDCRFKGDPVSGPERERLGISHTKQWFYCNHGDRKSLVAESARRNLLVGLRHYQDKPVCQCEGCGPRCPGYVAGDEG